MSSEYYHLSPVILTDAMFFALQPQCVVTGSFDQRQTAYLVAEQQMIDEIGTPLVATDITGTYPYPMPYSPLVLEYDRVNRLDFVYGLARNSDCACTLESFEGCGVIRDGYGYIDTLVLAGRLSGCGCGYRNLYQLVIGYNAGLPTGVAANDRALHLGLTMAAAQVLREISAPGSNEGGPGAPGLTGWSAQGYSENRVAPEKTSFGQNAIGTYIRGLVEHLRRKRALKF